MRFVVKKLIVYAVKWRPRGGLVLPKKVRVIVSAISREDILREISNKYGARAIDFEKFEVVGSVRVASAARLRG